jgi:hypothetical protein
MSAKAKNAARLRRLHEKRSRKQAQQTQYEAWSRAGQNGKSKRFQRKAGITHQRAHSHPDGYCGNLGCSRCEPHRNDAKFAEETSCLFGKRWTSKRFFHPKKNAPMFKNPAREAAKLSGVRRPMQRNPAKAARKAAQALAAQALAV